MEIGTDEKALHINLDSTKYGTFAEIGAGQEVARRFFRVGWRCRYNRQDHVCYDVTFSDAIYGPADRYVSRVRLQTMLDQRIRSSDRETRWKIRRRENVLCLRRYHRGAQFQRA